MSAIDDNISMASWAAPNLETSNASRYCGMNTIVCGRTSRTCTVLHGSVQVRIECIVCSFKCFQCEMEMEMESSCLRTISCCTNNMTRFSVSGIYFIIKLMMLIYIEN